MDESAVGGVILFIFLGLILTLLLYEGVKFVKFMLLLRRYEKLVDFNEDPAQQARSLLSEPFYLYIASLRRACDKKMGDLSEFPSEWRAAMVLRIEGYWISSIGALMNINEEATLAALRSNHLSTVAPFRKEEIDAAAETVEAST